MNTNPIVLAVAPLKDEAIAYAEISANNTVKSVTEALAAANYDLNVVAPYPRSSGGDYWLAMSKYRLYQSLTTWRESTGMPGKPRYADMSVEKIERFVKQCKEDAAFNYDRFVEKLVTKIGDVDTAILEGNHVWGYSYLTVTKQDATEIWHTRQICNVSKHGKLFPQWPSRKVKTKKL